MRLILLFLISLMTACGGSLSKEQRRQMREKIEANKIVRITEVEIIEAAYAAGRDMMKTLDSLAKDSARVDSFLKTHEGQIRFITPDSHNVHALEKQLVEAYLATETGFLQDNVQELRKPAGDFDSLLYTKPVTKKVGDGTDELQGVWSIWLPKKRLVISIGKTK